MSLVSLVDRPRCLFCRFSFVCSAIFRLKNGAGSGGDFVPCISDAQYQKNDGSVRMGTTFYDHLKVLETSAEEAFGKIFRNEKDPTLVEQRRFFLMRHLVAKSCPSLASGGSAASGSSARAHKNAHNAQTRENDLLKSILEGLITMLGKLAPRGNGRNMNARTALHKTLLVGLLNGIRRGQYSEAARLLSREEGDDPVHMRVKTIRQHARYVLPCGYLKLCLDVNVNS